LLLSVLGLESSYVGWGKDIEYSIFASPAAKAAPGVSRRFL